MRAKMLLVAALLALGIGTATPAKADEAAFLLTGRTSQVQVVTREYGGRTVYLFVNVLIPAISPLVQEIQTTCIAGLAACENLGLVLGSCAQDHSTLEYTEPWGERVRVVAHYCRNPREARCVTAVGHAMTGLRTERVYHGFGRCRSW